MKRFFNNKLRITGDHRDLLCQLRALAGNWAGTALKVH